MKYSPTDFGLQMTLNNYVSIGTGIFEHTLTMPFIEKDKKYWFQFFTFLLTEPDLYSKDNLEVSFTLQCPSNAAHFLHFIVTAPVPKIPAKNPKNGDDDGEVEAKTAS